MPKMIRGGGSPCQPMASMPTKRMGPPPRSLATDAHDCIMVWIPAGIHRIQGCGDDDRYDLAGSPQIVLSVAVKEGRVAALAQRRSNNSSRWVFEAWANLPQWTRRVNWVFVVGRSDRRCTSTKPEPMETGAFSRTS